MKQINTRASRLLMATICLFAGSFVLVSCKDNNNNTPDPVLAVVGVSPGTGKAADVITITGTGFDATASNNSVKFGTTAATVLAATTTTIVTQVPAGITGSQPIIVSNTVKGTTSAASAFNVTTVIGKTVVAVNAPITADVTWTKDKIYFLSNFVYVRSGVTVTIQPGTVIKGDKLTKGALIFEPGSKINAVGTAAEPIVFTSNQAPGLRNLGDWGGLVITGKGTHNGATGVTDPGKLPTVEGGPTTVVSAIDGARNTADNSGTLQYVRIEWAGVALSPNNEINGLSLYAVGSGTTIDHVQVSYANDDSIEWFGGDLNLKYLICYRGIDDDFDTDNGFNGSVQFGLGVRDLTIADQSGSKGFESDNDGNNSNNQPQTTCVFSNMTLTGPTAVSLNAAGTAYVTLATPVNPNASAPSANYVAGVHIRRNSALSMFNSVVLGWPAGILFDGTNVATNIATGRSVVANNIIGGNLTGPVNTVANQNRDVIYISGAGGLGSLTPINQLGPDSSAFGAAVGPVTYINKNNNRRYKTTAEFLLTDAFKFPAPNALPAAGSPALTGASFSNAKLGAFFNKTVTFVGAVGTGADFTTEAWVNFDTQNIVYQ